ncbi:glycosyltransferase family 117 protein [Thermophagus sp. OGC60D27]|uniref:glycosyltransferase family 117 protein n=1 Tax=Thermophagus sp. OGC60D27 TaxID=3458415 RepID=UPI004038438E
MRWFIPVLRRNLSGLLVLMTSLIVYFFTVSPTVSFWDCGEFIASAYRLQVPHPPGAPVYLLLARFFSMWVSDASMVAFSINILSVIASTFSVFFLYKILLLLLGVMTTGETLKKRLFMEMASVAGALMFAFTDSMWYSAVESEVYASSLFFSMITLWLFLSWYLREKDSSRLFFLGVYLLGLSIGVHLLNLLFIPVFVMLFVWKVRGHTVKFTIQGILLGVFLLGVIHWGLIVNGLVPAMCLEGWLVNDLGFPKHSGLIVFAVVLGGIHVLGLILTCRSRPVFHFGFLVSTLILIGWFSYAFVLIRAEAGCPINMNSPDNVFSLNEYINRTQYGNRPLLYGHHAGAKVVGWEQKKRMIYDDEGKRYKEVASNMDLYFSSEDMVWFPRIYSRLPQHIEGYQWWLGESPLNRKPGLFSQVSFFLRYQMGFSFLRYIMWNFVGRQNDSQGHGDILSGNWATGIGLVDGYRLGSRKYPLAEDIYSSSANHYFGIPLFFTLVGLLFLLREGRGRKRILVLLGLIFVMTGPAVVFYLNQPPFEPRERDYVYIAAYMSLSAIGGVGVFALLKGIYRISASNVTLLLSGLLILLAGPGLLFSVNLNDHNRSSRYLAHDLAISQLRSCPPNAILFTYGDNDTYPLWYAQQVENIRMDVRIVNLGLLSAPWYVKQIKKAVQGSGGLSLTLPFDFYLNHQLDYVGVSRSDLSPVEGSQALLQLKRQLSGLSAKDQLLGEELAPVWELRLPNEEVLVWRLSPGYLSTGSLVLYDIISSNIENHAVCFTRNVDRSALHGLDHHFIPRGLVWQVGQTNSENGVQGVLADYSLFMDSIRIGRSSEVWWDNTCRQALDAAGYREAVIDLSHRLLSSGYQSNVVRLLKKSIKEYPYSPYMPQLSMVEMARLLVQCNEKAEAEKLVRDIIYVNLQDVYYFVYSGFDTSYVKHRYCELFGQLRALAEDLDLTGLLAQIDTELHYLCGF